MKLILSVICEEVREREDGRMDIMGVFNELGAPGFPAAQDRMTVVFIIEWSADEAGEQPIRADLVDEAGDQVLTIQGHTDVEQREPRGAPPQTRLVLPLQEVVFPHKGPYHFELIAGGTVLSAAPIFLRSM
jgi:hypothetical protein